MEKEPRRIFGIDFMPAEPPAAVALRTAQFIVECGGRYHDQYNCFECPPYKETFLISLHSSDTMPVGLSSLWFCNGISFVGAPGELEELEELNEDLGLTLNDKTGRSYGALASKSLTLWNDLALAEPRRYEAQIKASLGVDSVLTVRKNASGSGDWSVCSYHVSYDDYRIARVRYEFDNSGRVDRQSIGVDLLDNRLSEIVVIR